MRIDAMREGVDEQELHNLIMALWQNQAPHHTVAAPGEEEEEEEEGAAGLFSCTKLFTGKCDGLAAAHQ